MFDARLAPRPGEILVQFEEESSAAVRLSAIEAVGGRIKTLLNESGDFARVALGNGITVEQAVDLLSRLAGVRYAEAGRGLPERTETAGMVDDWGPAASPGAEPTGHWGPEFPQQAPISVLDLAGGDFLFV